MTLTPRTTCGALYCVRMADDLRCFRCGESLASLSLPLSRQDECPSCSVYLHVCRMCSFFDPSVPKQCREDDAEEVFDKEKFNYCEWFRPARDVFDAARAKEVSEAKDALAALFGDGEAGEADDDALRSKAEDLFK